MAYLSGGNSVIHRPTPTAEQLAAFRSQLEEQRGFRVDQLRLLLRTRAHSSPRSEVTVSLLAGARAAYADVTAALLRMHDGTYGYCTDCGEPMPIERLEVLPQVARCAPCQLEAEVAT